MLCIVNLIAFSFGQKIVEAAYGLPTPHKDEHIDRPRSIRFVRPSLQPIITINIVRLAYHAVTP